jgi:hypothetical protein
LRKIAAELAAAGHLSEAKIPWQQSCPAIQPGLHQGDEADEE